LTANGLEPRLTGVGVVGQTMNREERIVELDTTAEIRSFHLAKSGLGASGRAERRATLDEAPRGRRSRARRARRAVRSKVFRDGASVQFFFRSALGVTPVRAEI
jgi:hypothetical protein